MSGSRWLRSVLLVGFLGVVTTVICANAWAWPWDLKKDNAAKCELKNLMKSPSGYMGQEVTFTCRFALQGKLFKHFSTRFNPAEHINFAVWPLDAKLWDKSERRNVLPTLYVDKSAFLVVGELKKLKRYDQIYVCGQVMNNYANLPWILVSKIRVLQDPEDVITDAAITHMRQGLDLMDQGKNTMAARHIEMALESGLPKVHEEYVKRKLASCYNASGRVADAVSLLKPDPKGKDKDIKPEMMLELAEMQLKSGDAAGALESCKKVVAVSADYPQVHALMGEAYGILGNMEQALEQCELAVTTPGLSAEEKAKAEVHRARVLVHGKMFADAVRAYARAIGEGSPLAAVPWLRKEIGRLYESRFDESHQQSLLDEAAREYGNANVLANNGDPEALFLIARAAFKRAKLAKSDDFSEAEEYINLCFALDPGYLSAKLLQGQIFMIKGDTEAAEKAFGEAFKAANGNPEARGSLAEMYERLGKKREARDMYAKTIEVAPQNRKALAKHAELSEELGDMAAAESSYRTLSELYPDDLAYRFKLGRAAAAIGKYEDAAGELEIAAGAPGMQGQDAQALLADVMLRLGDEKGAEKAYRQILAADGSNLKAKLGLAGVLSVMGASSREAVALASEVAKAMPGEDANKVLGMAKVRVGENKEGADLLSSVSPDGMCRVAWYLLGVARFNLNDYKGAREALAKASAPLMGGEKAASAEKFKKAADEMLQKVKEAEVEAKREARRREREERHAKRMQEALEKQRMEAEAADKAEEKTSEAKAEKGAEENPFAGLQAPVEQKAEASGEEVPGLPVMEITSTVAKVDVQEPVIEDEQKPEIKEEVIEKSSKSAIPEWVSDVKDETSVAGNTAETVAKPAQAVETVSAESVEVPGVFVDARMEEFSAMRGPKAGKASEPQVEEEIKPEIVPVEKIEVVEPVKKAQKPVAVKKRASKGFVGYVPSVVSVDDLLEDIPVAKPVEKKVEAQPRVEFEREEDLSKMAAPAEIGVELEEGPEMDDAAAVNKAAGKKAAWTEMDTATSGATVELEDDAALPKNEIRDLPDWAK